MVRVPMRIQVAAEIRSKETKMAQVLPTVNILPTAQRMTEI